MNKDDLFFKKQIEENNKTHIVNTAELHSLIVQSEKIFLENFSNDVWMERSIFTNWTCGIADCKYCYLSTKPKLDKKAVRSKASILAESFVCKEMGWRVGYITGGLRVESTEYMVSLLEDLRIVLGEPVAMNYGPYTKTEVAAFAPHVSAMGAAIESFDPALHSYICPSKPLSALTKFLGYLKDIQKPKFITIILGIGEKMSDVDEVIAKISEYGIERVQLCFLKPQQLTVFETVPAPDMHYMAWWTAKLRIAHPKLFIKIAVVKERISDLHIVLKAGANAFSRYMVFDDFAQELSLELEAECKKAGRNLIGKFTGNVTVDLAKIDSFSLEPKLRLEMKEKAQQYVARLQKLTVPSKNSRVIG